MSTCGKGIVVLIVLFLVIGCGKTEPTPTPVPPTPVPPTATNLRQTQDTAPPPTDTPKPTATSQPPNASIPTGTPSPTASSVPTEPPAPTATATATEAPTLTPTHEPVTRAGVKTYGGPYNDAAFDILLTANGGALIAGLANNERLSHRITPGDARLIKTDSEGDILWEKDYGGEDDAFFSSIIRTREEDYVLLGEIAASYLRDESDMFLVKVDEEGNEIWSHTYGGRGMDLGKMVRQTADGGYILIGDTADEFPTRNVYQSKISLIKTDAEGNEVWSQTYGDQILYLGWGVAQTPDGGYILTGWEAKTIDDRDVITIKTNEMGDVEWSRTWDLGPGERDGGFDLILTSDGHIVIACIQSMGSGAPSAVLLKVDLDGNEVWNKLIGEEGVGNTSWHIMEDSDGGYVAVGDTHLGKVPATGEDIHGGLMIKTDADGEILWQRIFGEGDYEQASFNSAVVLPDGGYVVVGRVTRKGERYSDILWWKIRREVIAFTSERDGNSEIYTMTVTDAPPSEGSDGGDLERLTHDPAYDAWPSWSPDGSQIAFTSDRSGNPDIFITTADGSHVRQLTHHSGIDIWPDWSPDGTRIAFASRRDGNFEIYVINSDGSNLQRLTNTPSQEDFPAWSPDGSQIVFSRIAGKDGTYVMNADGSDERKLTDIVALESAWSPDGTRIAFGSDYEGFQGIYVMDVQDALRSEGAEGSNVQRLSRTRSDDNCPAWSPDGTRIVFASWRDGDGEIYVMGSDGSYVQQLTDNRFEEVFPAWRPLLVNTPASLLSEPSPSHTPVPPTATPQSAGDELIAQPKIKGRVDVGGYSLYINCIGTGTPTVIMEAGWNDVGDTWHLVQPEIAELTRVCSYDRAGLGNSEPGRELPTISQGVNDLHTLLENAGVEGPYILVGHSWGGLCMRLYTDIFPEEVVGLVLVDSSHPDSFRRNLAVLPPESPDDSESLKFYRDWFSSAITDPTVKLDLELYEAGSLGDLPLVVLTAMNKKRADDFPADLNAKFNEIWLELQKELTRLSSDSTHIVSQESEHYIQEEQPELVIDAILQVIREVRP